MKFDKDFDREKSLWTKKNRDIDFVEARAVWNDPDRIEGPGDHKDGEERWLTVGEVHGKLWTVGWTMRMAGIRIFTVRPPRDDERDAYYGAK